jgi:uncharacterized protein
VLKKAVLFIWCAVASLAIAFAQGLQPIPALTAHVIDQTGTLDAIQRQGLEDKLMAFEKAKGTQVAIFIVATTQPEDIASFANRVGNTWKIGRKDVGDGVLLLVAKNDRKVRIEVAKTLEGAIPDLAAKHIIDEAITPNFRSGDYAGGLRAAADRIIARVSGEALPEPPQQPSQRISGPGFDWMDLVVFLFFGSFIVGGILRRVLGNKLGALITGSAVGVITLLVTASMLIAGVAAFVALLMSMMSGRVSGLGTGRGGGGFWSSGGGSSWGGGGSSSSSSWGGSGGGGDFGGGGASGDW